LLVSLFSCCGRRRVLPSFPTRRSSDLALGAAVPEGGFGGRGAGGPEVVVFPVGLGVPAGVFGACEVAAVGGQGAAGVGGDVVALGGGHVQGAVGVHGVAPAGGVFEAVVAAAEAAQVAFFGVAAGGGVGVVEGYEVVQVAVVGGHGAAGVAAGAVA